MEYQTTETCPKCGGSGADPNLNDTLPDGFEIPRACYFCSTTGEVLTPFGQAVLQVLAFEEHRREAMRALR